MFFLEWSPKLPTANLWTPERKQSIRYLFNTLKVQVLLPAATNPVSQANTTRERIQRGTQIRKAMKLITNTGLFAIFKKKKIKKENSRKTYFGRSPAVTIS